MRREAAVLVVAGLALSLSSCTCPEGKECLDPQLADDRPCPDGQICMEPPDPTGDEVAGCEAAGPEDAIRGDEAASLVKVNITLDDKGGQGCVTEKVSPKGVCVLQGGVIRWRVHDKCDLKADGKALLVIQGVPWLTDTCDPQFNVLDRDPRKNELFCNVPAEEAVAAVDVEHAYTVEGPNVRPEDPWIVVKRPR
jgi:hypothetical protein